MRRTAIKTTSANIRKESRKIIGESTDSIEMIRFNSTFGTTPEVCALLWNLTCRDIEESGAKPKHLLWALCFLREYGTEVQLAMKVGSSEKNLRKWVRIMVTMIASLFDEVVSINARICFLILLF